MSVTITRLYEGPKLAREALDDLIQAGVAEDDISVVTTQDDVAEIDDPSFVADPAEAAGTAASIGGLIGGAGGFLAGLGVIAIPGMAPLVAAGWIASTAAGVVAGAAASAAAGGLIGTLTDLGVSREAAESYVAGIQRGSTLITVRVDESHEAEVRAILDTHGPETDPGRAGQSSGLAVSGLAPDATTPIHPSR